MKEEYLHYIWKFGLYKQTNLRTTDGKEVQIIKAGQHNTHAGPDFFNAQIKSGKTKWAGNVEIHINGSDWRKHKHHEDKAYDNVILHVVFNNDTTALNSKEENIPTLDISKYLLEDKHEQYRQFMVSKKSIPCQNNLCEVDDFIIDSWLERLVIQRLERKSGDITLLLKNAGNDWAEAFYISLAKNFGFKTNAMPFELLARSLPQAFLAKHKDNLFQVEAMLFGQAGMLNKEFEEEYPNALKTEYRFLKQKFSLKPIEEHLWKFLRLRPPNFPTIRIAQFAALVAQSSFLFSEIINTKGLTNLTKLFNVKASEYWNTHYMFDKPAKRAEKQLGSSSVNVILINTAVPFTFVYGRQKQKEEYCDKAIDLLTYLPAEKNAIIEQWKKLNLSANSAYSSQALIELTNEYCSHKKCLNCSIGNQILKQ